MRLPYNRMSKLRFIHLSDIHFGQEIDGSLPTHEDVRANLVVDCQNLARELGPANGVLVTGDIAFSGQREEYQRAGEWLDQVTAAGGCDVTAVRVVPGNHDVDITQIDFLGTLAHKELRGAAPTEVNSILEKIMKGDESANPLLRKFAAYREFAARYGCDFESGNKPMWVKNSQFDDINLLRFLGFNSGQVSDLSDSKGRMVLGNTQYIIYPPTGPHRYEFVVLMHHPLSWFIDGHTAEKYLRRARVIMVGHEHHLDLKKITREDGSEQLEIYAGATNPNESSASYTYRYNWIEFELKKSDPVAIEVTVHPRVWDSDNPSFTADFNRLKGQRSAKFSLSCPNFDRHSGTASENVTEAVTSTQTSDANLDDNDPGMASKNTQYARLRYFFWKYLDWQQRLEILVELRILPTGSNQPVPQTMERLALEAAYRDNKLAQLWTAVMKHVPADKRESNPFEGVSADAEENV
jgi:GTPase-associated adaptor domain/Calcineurin-like phosphoesterase